MLCKHNLFLEPKALPAFNSQVGPSRTFLALCGSGPALEDRRRPFYGSISLLEEGRGEEGGKATTTRPNNKTENANTAPGMCAQPAREQ